LCNVQQPSAPTSTRRYTTNAVELRYDVTEWGTSSDVLDVTTDHVEANVLGGTLASMWSHPESETPLQHTTFSLFCSLQISGVVFSMTY